MGSKLKVFFILSLSFNLVFLVVSIGFIYKSGGISNVRSPAKSAKASNEYSPYYLERNSLFEKLSSAEGGIVFLGDSITNHGEWNEFFSNVKTKNRGIGGDTTKGVINRIDNIIKVNPEKIFIMIGVNDLRAKTDVHKIVSNYIQIVESIKRGSPNTEIYMESVLPVNIKKYETNFHNVKGDTINIGVEDLNKQLKGLASKLNVTYIDVYSNLVKGKQLPAKYTIDGIHLTGEAYEMWNKILKPYVNDIKNEVN